MKKCYSELLEALYEEYLLEFEHGLISEAELREFEADACIDEEETPQKEKPLETVTH
jgi:hypothetical protein